MTSPFSFPYRGIPATAKPARDKGVRSTEPSRILLKISNDLADNPTIDIMCGTRLPQSRDDAAVAAGVFGVGMKGLRGAEMPIALDREAAGATHGGDLDKAHPTKLGHTMTKVAKTEGDDRFFRVQFGQ